MTADLFASLRHDMPFAEGAMLLAGMALADETALLFALQTVIAEAPLRHMVTPGGFTMSVAMTNCGQHGWVADLRGYRYVTQDPQSAKPWPPMPAPFLSLATTAAAKAGYPGFIPDACLINRYVPGSKLSLHQDKDEQDLDAPIVSVSLGLPAVFLFGGHQRNAPTAKISLQHGDVVVWGGTSRLAYHGIMPIKEGSHPQLGAQRFNLTFRKHSIHK